MLGLGTTGGFTLRPMERKSKFTLKTSIQNTLRTHHSPTLYIHHTAYRAGTNRIQRAKARKLDSNCRSNFAGLMIDNCRFRTIFWCISQCPRCICKCCIRAARSRCFPVCDCSKGNCLVEVSKQYRPLEEKKVKCQYILRNTSFEEHSRKS